MFLICNVNDKTTLFDIIFMAMGLVMLLQESCDLYKSRKQADFRKREDTRVYICFLIENPALGATRYIQGW